MSTREKSNENKIFTIPNILSVVRLLLIPVLVWLYMVREEYAWAACVLVLSGLTDTLDGYIARHFCMISNLGKILDPIADKLTQGTVLICLASRFSFMGMALCLFVLKEILNATLHIIAMKKSGKVYGANWHGKVMTCLLYAVMLLHIIWVNISAIISSISITVCIVMMIISSVLYTKENILRIKNIS